MRDRDLEFDFFCRYKIGYICRSFEDAEADVESSTRTVESAEENIRTERNTKQSVKEIIETSLLAPVDHCNREEHVKVEAGRAGGHAGEDGEGETTVEMNSVDEHILYDHDVRIKTGNEPIFQQSKVLVHTARGYTSCLRGEYFSILSFERRIFQHSVFCRECLWSSKHLGH